MKEQVTESERVKNMNLAIQERIAKFNKQQEKEQQTDKKEQYGKEEQK